MGQQGRERAEALFSEAAMEAHYDRIYREMIDARRNPSWPPDPYNGPMQG